MSSSRKKRYSIGPRTLKASQQTDSQNEKKKVNFCRSLYRNLKVQDDQVKVTKQGVEIYNTLFKGVLHKVLKDAEELRILEGRGRVMIKDLEAAIKLNLPSQVAKYMIEAGQSAVEQRVRTNRKTKSQAQARRKSKKGRASKD